MGLRATRTGIYDLGDSHLTCRGMASGQILRIPARLCKSIMTLMSFLHSSSLTPSRECLPDLAKEPAYGNQTRLAV